MNESMNIVTLVQIHAKLSHSEDGEMSQLILAFRHMILNLSPRRLRPSTLPLSHGCAPQLAEM